VRRRLRTPCLRGEAGYSLIEMLTVMLIMSVVFAGITSVFVAGSKAQNEQSRRFQAQLNTRQALDKIRKDIHCATDVTPFATNSVTLKLPSGCGGDVSWCNVFPAFAHTAGCGCLASLQLDFPVSLKGSTIGQYELTDTIYLRNSTRI
jgi:prepilin-type N-terminal cleavage/methylation domain-containing protein